MTTQHRVSTTLQPSAVHSRLLHRWIACGRELLRTMKNRRATQRSLMMLNDHQLADIGLVRADIDAVAAGRRPARVLVSAAPLAECLHLPRAATTARSNGQAAPLPEQHSAGSRAA